MVSINDSIFILRIIEYCYLSMRHYFGFNSVGITNLLLIKSKHSYCILCFMEAPETNAEANYDFGEAEHVKLPSPVLTPGEPPAKMWIDRGLAVLRRGAIKKHLQEFKPDLALFEFYPFAMQYRDKDLDVVRAYSKMQEQGGQPKAQLVSLARDVAGNVLPGTSAKAARRLQEDFDETLVRGDGRFVRLDEGNKLFTDLENVTYAGNVVGELPERQEMAEEERPVVVNAGGGFDGSDMRFYRHAIEARKHSSELLTNPWVVTVSKDMSDRQYAELQRMVANENSLCAKALGLEVDDPSYHPMTIDKIIPPEQYKQNISNAAAAFTRGGYNNNFELIKAGIPYAISPRPNDSEQKVRAKKVEEHGFGKAMYHKRYTPEDLAQALDTEYRERSSREVSELDFGGAEKMAECLAERATQRARESQAKETESAQSR